MKYISRLTALLLAMMMLLSSTVLAEGGIGVPDLKEDWLEQQYTIASYGPCGNDNKYCVQIDELRGKTYAEIEDYLKNIIADSDALAEMLLGHHYYYHYLKGQDTELLCICGHHAHEVGADIGTELYFPYGDEKHLKDCPWGEPDTGIVAGSNSSLQISVPDDAFADEYKLNAALVLDAETLAAIDAAIAAEIPEDSEVVIDTVDAYDITFTDATGKVQPAKPVTLTFTVPTTAITTTEEDGTTTTPESLVVYHMIENADGTYTAELVGEGMPVDPEAEYQTVTVEATEFSIYVVGSVGSTNGDRVQNNYVSMEVGQTIVLYSDYTYDNNQTRTYYWMTENGSTNFSQYSNMFDITTNGRYITITAKNAGSINLRFGYIPYGNTIRADSVTVTATGPTIVTFNPNGGTGSNHTIKTMNGVFVFPTLQETGITPPVGAQFGGWGTRNDNQGNTYASKIEQTVSRDTTYYAQWYYPDTPEAKWTPAYFYIRTDGAIQPEPAQYDDLTTYYPQSGEETFSLNGGYIYTPIEINNNLDAVQANVAKEPSAEQIKKMGITDYDPMTQKVVWYVIKLERQGNFHVDGVIRNLDMFEVAYHANKGVVTQVPGSNPYAEGVTVTVQYNPRPTRTGYVFMGWSENPDAEEPTYSNISNPETFKMPARDVDLYAIWRPSDSTQYKVEHYLCDVNGNNAQLAQTQTLYGTTGKTAGAAYLTTFPGYEPYPEHTGTVAEGVIDPEGKLVLKLYYKPSVSTLTISKTGMEDGESAIFTVTAFTKAGGTTTPETFTVVVPNDGSVTLKDLLIGKAYTVTEQTDWTWRYTSEPPENASGTIAANGTSVTFKNKKEIEQWLSTEAAVHNDFSKDSTPSTTR